MATRTTLRLTVGVAAASIISLSMIGVSGSAATYAATSRHELLAASAGPFATLLFARTQITAADNCVGNDAGIARLDTVVAPYLQSRGMTGTGTLVTDRTNESAMTCTHYKSSLTASWSQAASLADTYGWSFVSHTATYPSNLLRLTAAQSQAETCGSASTLENHGLPGARGLIAYPGAQGTPTALQTNYGSKCFAWGRRYGFGSTTPASAGQTSPYWQNTGAPNGGPCHVSTASCYTIQATGSTRYTLPARTISHINELGPDEWITLQTYLLVTGKSPAYSSSPIRWDCTASNPKLHWSNDNERYCYRDWQTIMNALAAVPGIIVTDPLTVGIAFGRPATYP